MTGTYPFIAGQTHCYWLTRVLRIKGQYRTLSGMVKKQTKRPASVSPDQWYGHDNG